MQTSLRSLVGQVCVIFETLPKTVMLHSSEELINVWLTEFSMSEAITVLNGMLTEHNRAADCTAAAFLLSFHSCAIFFMSTPLLDWQPSSPVFLLWAIVFLSLSPCTCIYTHNSKTQMVNDVSSSMLHTPPSTSFGASPKVKMPIITLSVLSLYGVQFIISVLFPLHGRGEGAGA